MTSEINPDVFLSEVPQQRDELNDLKKVVSNEHLITMILVVLPEKWYLTIDKPSISDPT